MYSQTTTEEKRKIEDFLSAKNLSTITDFEDEYSVNEGSYLLTKCVDKYSKIQTNATPYLIAESAICTALIRAPKTASALYYLYLLNESDRKIFGDNETDKDVMELFVSSNKLDIEEYKISLLDELYDVYKEASEENWDGHDAIPVSRNAYLEAEKIINALPQNLGKPDILPEPTGEIAFEWYKGKRFVFVMSVGGNSTISYAGLFGKTSKINGTEHFSEVLPNFIVEQIRRLLEGA